MAPWLCIPNENESNTSNGQSIWLRRLGSFHCKLFEERREESSFRLFHQKGSPRTTQRQWLPSPIVWVAMAGYGCCFHLGIHLLEFITTWLFFGQSVPWFTGRCGEWFYITNKHHPSPSARASEMKWKPRAQCACMQRSACMQVISVNVRTSSSKVSTFSFLRSQGNAR